jgi:hypothetical protein
MDAPAGAASDTPARAPRPNGKSRESESRHGERHASGRRGRSGKNREHGREPQQRAAASVTRIDEARTRRMPQPPARSRNDDGDAAHLPAFLLRPVRPVPVKA